MPSFQPIQFYREQLNLLPIPQFVNTIAEIWRDLPNRAAERLDSSPLDVLKRIFANDQTRLKCVAAVDENESPAVIDVAEQLFRVIACRAMRKPAERLWAPQILSAAIPPFADRRLSPITCNHQVGSRSIGPSGVLHNS